MRNTKLASVDAFTAIAKQINENNAPDPDGMPNYTTKLAILTQTAMFGSLSNA